MSTACRKCGADLHPGLCGACEREELKTQLETAKRYAQACEWALENEQEYVVKLKDEIGQLMVDTAERQREACALQLHGLLTLRMATAIWVGADDIRETPLVVKLPETK